MLRPALEAASLPVHHPRGQRPLCDGIISGSLPARRGAVAEGDAGRTGRETGRVAVPRDARTIALAWRDGAGRPLSARSIDPMEGPR